jgi:hypothetical protein
MSFNRWYLSVLLFATNAFAQGSPNGTSPDDVFLTPNGYKLGNNETLRPLIRLTGWEGCAVKDPCHPDLDKKAAIKKGFEDMQTMIPAYEDVPDPSDPPANAYAVNWEDAAAVEFFGSFQKTGEHRSNVQSKFAIANANSASNFADVMRCRKFEYAGKSVERSLSEGFADASRTNHSHDNKTK